MLYDNLSIDDLMAFMQGNSKYNTCCCKYKMIHDGIENDAIADDECTTVGCLYYCRCYFVTFIGRMLWKCANNGKKIK